MPNEEMLEAHVKFELARWQGDALSESLNEEITAAFHWLDTVPLKDVLPVESAKAIIRQAANSVEISDTMIKLVTDGVRSAHQAALEDETLVGDLVAPEIFDRAVLAGIRLKALREAITEQVTTSEVYSQLMSHVVYQGIKTYVQTENVIAKKVPGASALMKASQSALSTARLDKAIDKQLTSFVNANLSDNIRDSRYYLDKIVDEKLLKAVADALWDANAKVSVAEYASLIPLGATDEFVEVGRELWNHIKTTETFDAFLEKIVDDFYKRNGKQKVGKLLADVSVTPDVVIDLTEPLKPAFAKAAKDGFIEDRIRARLSAFYDQY